MRITALVPARGGSKGIPKKNLVRLNGKPLIQYTIEAARASMYVDDIFISSDDPEIIGFCESLGVQVPYRRPEALATDTTSMVEMVLHALDWMRNSGQGLPDCLLLLQPTSPLRTARHIDEAVELFRSAGKESLMSVHEMTEHPFECVRMKENGWEFLAGQGAHTRRQDYMENFYFINGAIYLATPEFVERERAFFREGESALYFMEASAGVDIDDLSDLRLAEFYLRDKTGFENKNAKTKGGEYE